MAEQTSMRNRVLRCLEGGVERTADEIATILALDSRSICARLAQLRHAGLVKTVGPGNRRPGTTKGPRPYRWSIR